MFFLVLLPEKIFIGSNDRDCIDVLGVVDVDGVINSDSLARNYSMIEEETDLLALL